MTTPDPKQSAPEGQVARAGRLTLCGNCGLCKKHGEHRFDLPVSPLGVHRWDPVTSSKWSPCPDCATPGAERMEKGTR